MSAPEWQYHEQWGYQALAWQDCICQSQYVHALHSTTVVADNMWYLLESRITTFFPSYCHWSSVVFSADDPGIGRGYQVALSSLMLPYTIMMQEWKCSICHQSIIAGLHVVVPVTSAWSSGHHWDYWNMDQHTTLLIRSACPIWPDAWHGHEALVTMTMPCIMAYAIILLLHKQASSCHHCLHPLQQVYLLINEQWRHGSSIIISANQDMPDHPDNCHHCCWPLGCFTLHTFSKLISSLSFSHCTAHS